jgi:uncharacterized protein
MLDFDQIQEKVMDDLNRKLPDYLTYHNARHTQYVLDKTLLIAEYENVKEDEFILLKTAALYHDIGFLIGKDNHEEVGCQIAYPELLKWGFDEVAIKQILGMIMATKIPQKPKNLLENIVADADLEYLGTERFEEIGERLYQELLHDNPNLSREKWYVIQINFISAHQYHTFFCKKFREPLKLKNLEMLKDKMKG